MNEYITDVLRVLTLKGMLKDYKRDGKNQCHIQNRRNRCESIRLSEARRDGWNTFSGGTQAKVHLPMP